MGVTGGTFPYSYSWSNGATTDSIFGLTAGTYTIAVTDANGCMDTASVVIIEPQTLTLAVISSNVLCYGGNEGSASVVISGGTSPYSYAWSNGVLNDSISNLSAGTYSVTVTDAHGCQVTDTIVITEPQVLNLVTSSTNVQCNGANNGTATVAVSGGISPYTYAWSNGSTSDSISNVSPGTYFLTVSDVNGCQDTVSVVITEPQPLSLSVSSSNVLCFGGSDGTASITASGGTLPYSYSWSNGATTASISNLSAGGYSVTLTDANGCMDTASIQIMESLPISISVSSINVLCHGGSDGSISTTVSGGVAPYSYLWDNGVTTSSINNISAGNYTLYVTDASGCQDTVMVTITQPQALSLSATATSASCYGGNNGQASLSISGGVSPFTTTWSNGYTGLNPTGLTAGIYYVLVNDANGCQDTTSVVVTQPAGPISPSVGVISNVTCYGDSNGSAYVTLSGGTPPYTINWDNGLTGDTITGLVAGSYVAFVQDAAGCLDSISLQISQPSAALSVSAFVIENVKCKGDFSGRAGSSISGGTGPYTRLWSNGANSDTVSQLAAGTYSLTVIDANGCSATSTVNISEPSQGISVQAVYVNKVQCFGGSDGAARVIYSGGTVPYTISWSTGITSDTLQNLAVGVYSVIVIDAEGCSSQDTVLITGPSQKLEANSTVVNVNCHGDNSGSISINPRGGTPPYLAVWSNGKTGFILNNATVGIYNYVLSDQNGCTYSDTVKIDQNEPIKVAYQVVNETCPYSNDGAIEIQSSGGTGPYTWYCNGNVFNGLIEHLNSGSYGILVRDALGCDTSFTVIVEGDNEELYLHIPNAFTPNDDRINDKYIIYGSECIGASTFQIFDRWGDLVFSSHEPFTEFWNGCRDDGTKVKEDVYVWRFTSEHVNEIGHVVVIH